MNSFPFEFLLAPVLITRRSNFVILGMLWIASGWLHAGTSSSGNKGWDKWEGRCRWNLTLMGEINALSEDQMFFIRSYIAEQRNAVELLTKYGSLDGKAVEGRIQEIMEMSAAKIQSVFTPEQLGRWKEWEHLFATRRPVHRQTSLSASNPQ